MTTDQVLKCIREFIELVRKAEHPDSAQSHKVYCEGMINMACTIGIISWDHRMTLIEEVRVAKEVAIHRLTEEQNESI